MISLITKIKSLLRKENYIVFFSFVIFFFIFHKVFFNSLLTSWDSWYLPYSFIKTYIPSIWYDSYSTWWLYPLTFTQIPIFYLFNLLGADYNLWAKIIFYFPLLMLLIISWFFIPYKISKNKDISSIIFLLFSLNSFILSVIIWSTPLIALAYSLMPISFYYLYKYFLLKEYTCTTPLFFWLVFGIIIMLDIRYAHIFFLFIIMFFILNLSLKKITLNIKKIFIFALVSFLWVIIINLFWLLPYYFSWNDFISLPQWFDNPNWINVHTVNDFINLFSLKHSYWPNVLDWVKNNVEFYWFLFFPILVFSYIFNKNKNNNHYLILFLFSSILFLWSNFIIENLNTYIFMNIPTFNIQRDPFKYFVLVILSLYIFLLHLNIKQKWLCYIMILSIAFPILMSIKLNYWIFGEKEIPQDYKDLNVILSSDTSINRILWVPYKHRYGEFNTNKSAMQYFDFQSYWFLNLSKTDSSIIYNTDDFHKLLNIFWIKYLIVPYDPLWEWWEVSYSHMLSSSNFLETLKNDTWLIYKQLSDNLHLFINNNYYPVLDFKNLSFKKINSSKYKLKINNLNWSSNLNFLQSYHKEWKIYLWEIKNSFWCDILKTYSKNWKNIYECNHIQKYFNKEDMSYLYKKPIFDSNHTWTYEYANSWSISKEYLVEYIQKNYSIELQKEWYPKQLKNWKIDYKYYILNQDWSIDIELTLYFKPQSYFYLWILISWIALTLILWWYSIVAIFRKERGIK